MKLKYLSILVFTLILSCNSSKNIVKTTSEQKTNIIESTVSVVTKDTTTNTRDTINSLSEALKPTAVKNLNEVPLEKKDPVILPKKPTSSIHTLWHDLLQKHVSINGNVNYKGLKTDRKLLNTYFKVLDSTLPKETDSRAYTLAYWINTYNAFTVDLILRHYPIKSIKDIKDPWDQRYWKLGEKWYNLNEIEHEILREMNEPRIHFAIVCASFSCPKLLNNAFTEDALDQQLTRVTKSFLKDTNRNKIAKNDIKISKIFQWFTKDFKKNGSLIDFLNQYSEIQINSNAKKSYLTYNWELNQ